MKVFSVQCEKSPKTIEDIKKLNEKYKFYTSVQNAQLLHALFDEISDLWEHYQK